MTRTVILLNLAADAPRSLITGPPTLRPSWRHLWLARPGDIIIAPVEFDEDFRQYVGDTLNLDLTEIRVMVDPGASFEDDQLSSSAFRDRLKALLEDPGEWVLASSYSTRGTAELASSLGLRSSEYPFASQDGNALVNRKSHFRRLGAGSGLPLAAGSIVRSHEELESVVAGYVRDFAEVIVKRNNGGGGYGNVVVSKTDESSLPGARAVMSMEHFGASSREIWNDFTDDGEREVVVEEYIRAKDIFYLEYFVEGSGVKYLTSGDIRSRQQSGQSMLQWMGLQIPSGARPYSLSLAISSATLFAQLLQTIGYRGYLNLDCVASANGRIVFNEVNARWGGGTVLHRIMEHIYGSAYGDHALIRSVRDMIYIPLQTASRLLQQVVRNGRYSSIANALVLTLDPHSQAGMELALIGCSNAEIDALEDEVRAAWISHLKGQPDQSEQR